MSERSHNMKPEDLDELKRYIKDQVREAAGFVVSTLVLLLGLMILMLMFIASSPK